MTNSGRVYGLKSMRSRSAQFCFADSTSFLPWDKLCASPALVDLMDDPEKKGVFGHQPGRRALVPVSPSSVQLNHDIADALLPHIRGVGVVTTLLSWPNMAITLLGLRLVLLRRRRPTNGSSRKLRTANP
jgi:hypothetical protein